MVFGDELPSWVRWAIGVPLFVWCFLFIISKITDLWTEKFQPLLQPLFYDREEKRRSARRQRFADHVESEIRRLNNLEEWRDYRFAELEAEVEAEGRRRAFGLLPFVTRTRSGLRRERSLSKALESSQERLILLEGAPGSGKSVALRYVAQAMARRAMKASSTQSLIPIYINLKELARRTGATGGVLEETPTTQEELTQLRETLVQRFSEGELQTLCFDLGIDVETLPGESKVDRARELLIYLDRRGRIPELVTLVKNKRPDVAWDEILKSGATPSGRAQTGEAIDKHLIRAFVLKSLNRANDRDIEEFLEEEFDRGLREGTWLFLFDSFDELPEVLSSTEADAAIHDYADAIYDFLHGMNQCRGIVASRQFRGPGQLGWPRFRILPLSEERRLELVHKAELKPALEKELIGQLGTAVYEIRDMSSNPLFLGLLCEHVKTGNPFPENAHTVFETYIETRLTRDRERLERRFELEPGQVRVAAESLAFCMAADPGLGLSPVRERLQEATLRLGLEIGGRFETLLDALEYIKLARTETATAPGESRPFTFAHRRFQEYFATCVVLREPERVTPEQLLTNARWRETAVVMCQTQPLSVLSPLLEQARNLLAEMLDNFSGLIDVHVRKKTLPEPFSWPSGALHLLGLLQDGFGSRLVELPNDIRMSTGRLVLSASSAGTLLDRKWGLEVAGTVPQSILLLLLRKAFASKSQWLKEVAYRQTARLAEIPDDIAKSVRQSLIGLFSDGRLRHERLATHAYLSRLDKSAHFISVAQLLFWVTYIDLALHATVSIYLLAEVIRTNSFSFPGDLVLIVLLPLSHIGLRLQIHFEQLGSSLRVFLAFYIRLLACLIVLPTPSEPFSGQYWFEATSKELWLPFLFIWGPFALFSARTGQFTHPLWWPLMSIYPLIYFAWNAKESAAAIFSWLRKKWINLILLSVAGGLGFILVSFSEVIMVLCGVIQLLSILSIILIVILPWSVDWIRWRRWVRRHQVSMTVQELIELFGQYIFWIFRIRLVRTIREQGLLIVMENTEMKLEALAIYIEQTVVEAKGKSRGIRKEGTALKLMSGGGIECLDEVCMLLDQVRATRRANR
jgi:hypothetical protein